MTEWNLPQELKGDSTYDNWLQLINVIYHIGKIKDKTTLSSQKMQQKHGQKPALSYNKNI